MAQGANAYLNEDDIREAKQVFTSSDAALFQMESPTQTVTTGLKMARQYGCKTYLSAEPPFSLPNEVWSNIECLIVNEPAEALHALKTYDPGFEPVKDPPAERHRAPVFFAGYKSDPERAKRYSAEAGDWYLDYSKNLIDDEILNIDYKVVSFETVFFDSMGNAIPEVSNGSQFSERQKTAMRRLQHGKRFYISHVKATGPDGITRDISTIEVIVN